MRGESDEGEGGWMSTPTMNNHFGKIKNNHFGKINIIHLPTPAMNNHLGKININHLRNIIIDYPGKIRINNKGILVTCSTPHK